ncbi:hypothetical protein FRC06_008251 [Ceratobasidium sp. 370]|nr:hypothetical protein FRC06_008251 [Ceratobasidium sp. 370]
MAFAQVDRLAMPVPPTSSDLMGHHTGAEHVASGSFSPTQDADLLREAALRSRRARKQASLAASSQTLDTTAQLANDVARPSVTEDVRMDDATAHTVAEGAPGLHPVNIDTEDGEIFEDQNKNGSANDATEILGETASPVTRQNEDTPHSDQSREPTGTSRESSLDNSKFIRPSLDMTARDLDEAKRLILDLLGLGVTPEYLVDCGISSQCLAVCFYEMNLRFPLNLDRSKINLPSFYDVDKHMQASLKKDQAIRQRNHDQTTPKPLSSSSSSDGTQAPASQGTTLPTLNGSADIHKQKRVSLPSPPMSLPSKPVSQSSNKDELPCDTESTIQSKASTRLPPSGPRALKERMETMVAEDQKRMELLARKAAMDSITRKRAAKFSPKPNPGDLERLTQPRGIEDVGSAVDALLAAVRMDSASVPSGRGDNSEKGQYDGERSASVESGVDGALPDYDSDAMVEHELDTRSTSISDMDDGITPDPASILGNKRHLSPTRLSPVASDSTPPRVPLAVPSPRIRFELLDGNVTSGSFTPPTVAVPIAARKSRPTASDFIDRAPPRPSSAFAGDVDRNAPLKRKCSFVDPQVWPKRLVIDLDSSDEEDEDEDEAEGGVRASVSVASTSTSRGSVERTTSSGGSSRPGTDRGRDMAAQMLLEKELQIKAMMQKIKMRELKKKMGSVSTGGTPVLAAANIVSAPEGVVALPPSSGVSPPSGLSDIATTAMEATNQETGAGVASTLGIQQGDLHSASGVGVLGHSDNTLGPDSEMNAPKPDKRKDKATEAEAIVGNSKGVSCNKRFVSLLTR